MPESETFNVRWRIAFEQHISNRTEGLHPTDDKIDREYWHYVVNVWPRIDLFAWSTMIYDAWLSLDRWIEDDSHRTSSQRTEIEKKHIDQVRVDRRKSALLSKWWWRGEEEEERMTNTMARRIKSNCVYSKERENRFYLHDRSTEDCC